MDYNELYEKYKNVLQENQRLKAENEEYRIRLGLSISEACLNNYVKDNPALINPTTSINNNSSPADKIKLFMSLFKGRDDVYAKRWQNKEDKSGYSPVCHNEWANGVCNKPKIKCSECNNKRYSALTADVIDSHLRGKDVFGIYPMLTDETCYFLAIDFDGEGWEKDITAVRNICIENKIPFGFERSRSGNGAHVWFFFEDKVSAVSARKFGTALLTQAMGKRHELAFRSYDRLFPNQDTLPKGGLGNLIALPLQLVARKNNNSVFIDENFEPYPDQWGYLNSIQKLSEIEMELHASKLCNGSELGNLRPSEDEECKPWERNKIIHRLSQSDFPERINITMANMLYLPKDGFSQKALNTIKRLAAFKNPDFYKTQAMRFPTFNKPRVISLSEETSRYLCLPRGCRNELGVLLDEFKVNCEWIDETYQGQPIDVAFNGELRDEQAEAIAAMLKFDNGVLSATTAFGKTVIGAKLITERKVNTLILVHTQQLLEQWKERLNQFLILHETLPIDNASKRGRKKSHSIIGQLGAGKNNLNVIVDIAIMQSLVKGDEVKENVKNYGMVIVDECHHVPAFSFEQILKNVSAKYVYGLTATPVRQDGHHPIIFMQCGPVRYKVDALKQAEKRPFEHFIIPRFTPFRKPTFQDEKEWSIGEIYTEISNSEIRNQLIVDDIVKSVNEGRHPLVLTERTAHVETLATALKNRLPSVITLTGSMSVKEKKAAMETLSSVSSVSNTVLIATGRFVGEGFDEPRLDTLFLAMPIAWEGTVQQYAGRLHRLFENKNEVQIYDYVDIHVGVLEKMYHKRLKGYASIGYTAKSDSKPMESVNTIFDNLNFLTVFNNDILTAKNEILIVSPYISKKRINQMLNMLMTGINNGARVTVITRPETDYKIKDSNALKEMIDSIKNSGINVVFKSNIHQKFAIMDQRIVWYGSINLLSFGSAEESIMRLDSLNIAYELISAIGK